MLIKISNVEISGKEASNGMFRFLVCQDELRLIGKNPTRIESEINEDCLSVSLFAKEAGVTPQAVRKMISERRLVSRKVGEQYVILREELNRYLAAK